ncbi:Mitogen-activated protein kinase 15 [Orchesella cincta]|uniref:Mitogen-activated protein kinase 15 n=1 Tax=Orchesella cincta TaxID=48709 RepID=A0A1D2MEQ4_ORCCI|nr:Mitogen-activated protein kinase 15 [Orchesella cincta]
MLKSEDPVGAKRELQNLPKFIHDVAKGLKWIHDSQILHRDIKPENILIVMKANGSEIAKIGDFGVSRKLSTMSTGLIHWEKERQTGWLQKPFGQ